MLWLIFAAMALLAVGFAVLPLLRRGATDAAPARADYDIAIYKDQLRDIERDRVRGVIDAEQTAAARLEIERRLLAAATPASAMDAPAVPRARPWPLAIVVALLLVPGAALVYLQHGAPWSANAPQMARDAAPQAAFGELIAELERRLTESPDDRRGWVLLARGYARLGRMAEADAAHLTALSLTADDGEAAEIAAGFGQVLVEEAQGIVTTAARAAFSEALRRDPRHTQARYFLGLAKRQDGDGRAALGDWQALLGDAPEGAPWRAGLRQQIARLTAELDAPADPAVRQALIENMVAGLAARLEATRADGGGTAEEWAQLGRSYRVLARAEKARDAYGEAVKRAPDDIALLRDYAASVGDADGKLSPAYRAALRQLRDRLPLDSDERAAVDKWLTP